MFSDAAAKKGVTFPKGFKAAGVKAGIKKSGNLDVAVICSEEEAAVAGVFTQNAVAAAPVYVSKAAVEDGKARAIVANAGCANACTGEQGMKAAQRTAEIAAKALGCAADDVLVASTGVIGVNLPMDKLEQGVKDAVASLSTEGSMDAGNAIITTDTYSKACSTEVEIGGRKVRFGAIAKGSGMIQPNMATMLSFITTDAAIESKLLQEALSEITEVTFNMISVDGDMSTNDMVTVLANGAAGNAKITEKNADYEIFYRTLKEICTGLSERIAADGEGATKFLTVHVTGAASFDAAKQVAMSVAKSPQKTVVKFGGIPVYANGTGASCDADALRKVMGQHDIVIDVEMGLGSAEATVWTCDFSYEYVKINGEYHT